MESYCCKKQNIYEVVQYYLKEDYNNLKIFTVISESSIENMLVAILVIYT